MEFCLDRLGAEPNDWRESRGRVAAVAGVCEPTGSAGKPLAPLEETAARPEFNECSAAAPAVVDEAA